MSETLTGRLLDEIYRTGATRETIAGVYAECLRASMSGGDDFIDWPSANRALLEKYSKSGLIYIKRRAWKGLR